MTHPFQHVRSRFCTAMNHRAASAREVSPARRPCTFLRFLYHFYQGPLASISIQQFGFAVLAALVIVVLYNDVITNVLLLKKG